MGLRPEHLLPGQSIAPDLLSRLGMVASGSSTGRWLILFERGHWCAACRRHLAHVSERLEDIEALGITTVAITHEQELAIENRAYGFPLVPDPDLQLSDAFGLVHTDEFGAITVRPSALLVDTSGMILFSYVGDDSRDRPTVAAMLLALSSIV